MLYRCATPAAYLVQVGHLDAVRGDSSAEGVAVGHHGRRLGVKRRVRDLRPRTKGRVLEGPRSSLK